MKNWCNKIKHVRWQIGFQMNIMLSKLFWSIKIFWYPQWYIAMNRIAQYHKKVLSFWYSWGMQCIYAHITIGWNVEAKISFLRYDWHQSKKKLLVSWCSHITKAAPRQFIFLSIRMLTSFSTLFVSMALIESTWVKGK